MYRNSLNKACELKVLYQALQNVYEFVNNQFRPAKAGGHWMDWPQIYTHQLNWG